MLLSVFLGDLIDVSAQTKLPIPGYVVRLEAI